MKTTIKLLVYYFLLQFICACLFNFIGYMYSTLSVYINSGNFIVTPPNESTNLYIIIASLMISNLLFGWFLIHQKYVSTDKTTWSIYSPKLMLSIIPLTIGTMLWMNYAVELLELDNNLEYLFSRMSNNIFGIISIAIIAPVLEEMFFRGAIEGHLLKIWKNPIYAIVVSAAIFGIIHGNPVQIPFAMGHGLLLGWLFYKTGSLLPGIFLHFINNTTSTVLSLILPESANSMEMVFGRTNSIILSIIGLIFTILFIIIINRMTRRTQLMSENAQN